MIPITSFAYKPPPSPFGECLRKQENITVLFHEFCDEYNSKGNTPTIDADSPTLTYESALKFLIDNNYIRDDYLKTNPNCIYDLKHFPEGTFKFHNYKNIFYCKFHGSRDCGIKSFYPNELNKEMQKHRFNQRISSFMFHNQEFILLGFIILLIIIVRLFFKFILSK